jgi:diguanylate cyclase (GGDEF)-like protein
MDINLLKTLTLLYVEDEAKLQEEVCQNIAPFVKEVILATNGKEGLELFLQHSHIDLIISDIMMPKMDGIAMVDAIRTHDVDIPIIYATAFNDSSYLFKTIQQSVSSYILKPIDIELLLGGIEKAAVFIENKRLKDQLLVINEDLEKKVEQKTQELQAQNKQLHQLVYKDTLTHLPNRYSLLEDLKKLEKPSLILFDLDAFKNINDLYGEDVGNYVLQQVAKMLQKYAHIDNQYTLYKIGADEFAFLKSKIFDQDDCLNQINLMLQDLKEKNIFLEDQQIWIHLNATMGIALNATLPLQSADIALRRAKQKKIPYYIFKEEEQLHREYENDLKYSKIIARAIEEDLVVPFYQPIVDGDASVVKYEALMRIVIDGEILSPYHFLDISKKIRQYNALERLMIKKVFEDLHTKDFSVNINVSIDDVTCEDFIEFIKGELEQLDDASCVTFEFLEDENIFDYNDITSFSLMVKNYGAQLAIDDFGSGYSNFAHIVNLNLDFIKIDASLIKNIDQDHNAKVVVETINNYAHALGLKTVAEFVHSKEVFDILKTLDIDFYQGYYFSEPQQW